MFFLSIYINVTRPFIVIRNTSSFCLCERDCHFLHTNMTCLTVFFLSSHYITLDLIIWRTVSLSTILHVFFSLHERDKGIYCHSKYKYYFAYVNVTHGHFLSIIRTWLVSRFSLLTLYQTTSNRMNIFSLYSYLMFFSLYMEATRPFIVSKIWMFFVYMNVVTAIFPFFYP